MVSPVAVLPLVVASLAASSVDAHGTLIKPALKFTGTGYGGNFQSTIPMTSLTPKPGDIFTNYPDASKNAAAFDRSIQASQYKSLREFMYSTQDMSKGRFNMPKTAECGFTDPVGGAVQPLPDQVECGHATPNCRTAYPDGKFPYAKAKCEGKSRLTMYWLGTLMEWQVYIDCAKIGLGGSAASNNTAAIAAAAKKAPSSFGPGTAGQGPSSSGPDTAEQGSSSFASATDNSTVSVGTVRPRCKPYNRV